MRSRPILVIDDDPQFCDLVTGILARTDFEVLLAHDGWSGVERARSTQPAVILLDMVMRGLDGIITCQRLKHDVILRDIPVVGMTSSDDLKFTEKAFRAGADLFLPKPFQPVSLLHVVELALSLSQRERSIRCRRRHPRLEVSVRARCVVGGPALSPQELVGQTANVSLGGLLVCLPAMLVSGTLLRLGLNLPDGVVTAHGTVMWINSQSRRCQQCCHGVRLLGFAEHEGLVHYRRFLSQVAGDIVATPRP